MRKHATSIMSHVLCSLCLSFKGRITNQEQSTWPSALLSSDIEFVRPDVWRRNLHFRLFGLPSSYILTSSFSKKKSYEMRSPEDEDICVFVNVHVFASLVPNCGHEIQLCFAVKNSSEGKSWRGRQGGSDKFATDRRFRKSVAQSLRSKNLYNSQLSVEEKKTVVF